MKNRHNLMKVIGFVYIQQWASFEKRRADTFHQMCRHLEKTEVRTTSSKGSDLSKNISIDGLNKNH
nr:MAG TPA: hypothetical protein [Caudoviricetes sp.]